MRIKKLVKILKDAFPGHRFDVEASVNGLPPVDILFPDEKLIIEVQGPYHYLDKKKKLKNGSTILKINTYKKLGYTVVERLALDVSNREKQKQLKEQLSAYISNAEDDSEGSDYETGRRRRMVLC